ncbi:hypothetical protein METHB2_320028 [Candidatus Methylobacter favarea]|uniref:Uncharacterized protein n=1 Tax=Candidatus Methylobacter favarea TaxID=2707345 RepID=A0A8S0YA39_9GAMM|nr:hypothetical protein METHB2_320028 [Candidatus Methylobacter favarea]
MPFGIQRQEKQSHRSWMGQLVNGSFYRRLAARKNSLIYIFSLNTLLGIK